MSRERLGSRLGFILLSAGCAIGIGNVWKFPYTVGQYGGGIFVLIYLFFLIAIGVPVMTMEFAMGRAGQKSLSKLYHELQKDGQKWHYHGYASVVGNYMLMMFYTVVAGWMVRFLVEMAAGNLSGRTPEGIKEFYGTMLGEPVPMIVYTYIIILAGFAVCSLGVKNGLERISKIMMSALLIIMIILAVNSLFLDGGKEGLKFYLMPDVNKIKEIGLVKVIVAALSQAFFTLSTGIGSMAIFGSYLGKERSLLGESMNIALLDTFVAISSGLIIFPACFAYNIEPDSGPSLIFITLPNIFNNLPMGRLWGSLFFVFLTFAAFSTVIAVFENIIICTAELFNWSRKRSCIINCALLLVLSLPCVFGFNLLKNVQPLGDGSTIMDLEDFIVSNVLLPLGSLIIVLFCTLKKGWGWDNFIAEANQGNGLKISSRLKWYMTFVLPVVVIVVFVFGLIK